MDFSYRTDESPSTSPSTMDLVDEVLYMCSPPETFIGESYWDICSTATGDAWGADLGNSLIVPLSLDTSVLQDYPEGVDPSVLTTPPIPSSPYALAQHGLPPVPEGSVPGSAPIDSQARPLKSEDASYHLVQLRQMMDGHMDTPTRHLLASLLYYNNLLVGLNSAEANKLTSLVLGVSLRSVTRWKEEYHRDLQLRLDKAEDSNAEQPVPFKTVPKRSWLLEEYPDLLKRAHEWICDSLDAAEKNDRAFKITEFQQWVNSDLLRPLFYDAEKRVVPISHSTARSWLAKLGYYDRIRQTFGDANSSHNRTPTSFLMDAPTLEAASYPLAALPGRKRANTWSHHDNHPYNSMMAWVPPPTFPEGV